MKCIKWLTVKGELIYSVIFIVHITLFVISTQQTMTFQLNGDCALMVALWKSSPKTLELILCGPWKYTTNLNGNAAIRVIMSWLKYLPSVNFAGIVAWLNNLAAGFKIIRNQCKIITLITCSSQVNKWNEIMAVNLFADWNVLLNDLKNFGFGLRGNMTTVILFLRCPLDFIWGPLWGELTAKLR